MFKKILIANRGEIAVRIIRACKEWGISTVAVHSDVDRESMHVKLADESVCIGSHQPANSYLNIPALLSAINLTGAEAVHPGYGFLSENANFAKILEENKIKFIGASSEHIKMMGDKIQAKKIAKENGLPVIEGSEGGVKDIVKANELCKKIGFPILIKASGGGGGKGMKIVRKEMNLKLFLLLLNLKLKNILEMTKFILKNFFKIQDILRFKFCLAKIELFIYTKEIVLCKEDIKNLIEETPSPVLNDEIRKDLF